MSEFNPEWIAIHCTATSPEMTDVDARWVNRVHRRKGWRGGGYHEVIPRPTKDTPAQRQNHAGGFPTRPITQPGAHVGGCGREWNLKTLGISLAGGVDAQGVAEDNFHPDQIELLLEAIREYQELFNIPDERVIGHRDLIRMTNSAPKACPCFSVQALITQGKKRSGGGFNFKRRPPHDEATPIRATHKVRRGESLWGISAAYGIPISDLESWNGIRDVDVIRAGTNLRLRPPAQ